MKFTAVVSSKGRITFPISVRKKLNLTTKTKIAWSMNKSKEMVQARIVNGYVV